MHGPGGSVGKAETEPAFDASFDFDQNEHALHHLVEQRPGSCLRAGVRTKFAMHILAAFQKIFFVNWIIWRRNLKIIVCAFAQRLGGVVA